MEGETVEHVTLTSGKISGGRDRERLETDIGSIQGVRMVTVDPDAHTVHVEFDPREVSYTNIKATVEGAGYHVDSEDYGSPRDEDEPAAHTT